MIRVALADDQTLVRQALRMHLDAQPTLSVVAEVGSGEDLLAWVAHEKIDVAMIDIYMPGMGGLETMRRLRALGHGPKIIGLSSITTAAFVRDLFRDKLIDGYVSKDAAGLDLLRAVKEVAMGRRFVCPRLAGALETELEGATQRFVRLTEREREVLLQVFAGHDNKTIAQNLMLSEKTVSQHKQNALRKLGVQGEIEAYRLARLEGWVE